MISIKKIASNSLSLWMLMSVILVATACSNNQEAEVPVPEVTVAPVKIETVPVTQTFVGQTYGYSDIAIRARVDGFLEGLHFNEGSHVKKGQLLYTIDPAPQMARKAEAMSKVAEAKTILAKAESDVNRYRPLAEINAVAQSDLDAAEAQYGAAKASLEAAQASLDYANIQLGYTRIYAPISGFIGKTEAKVGDYVGKEPNPVVLNAVSSIDTILVRFSISESDYLEINRHLAKLRSEGIKWNKENREPLKLILADGKTHSEDGYVDFANREIDPTTGTMMIQASFPNPDKVLRPGLFAKVSAVMDVIENAMLIPQKSIREIQGVYNVFIVDAENKVKNVQVKVGNKIGADWIVLEGLQASDKVIVEGIQKVRTDMVVHPVPVNQQPETE